MDTPGPSLPRAPELASARVAFRHRRSLARPLVFAIAQALQARRFLWRSHQPRSWPRSPRVQPWQSNRQEIQTEAPTRGAIRRVTAWPNLGCSFRRTLDVRAACAVPRFSERVLDEAVPGEVMW